MSPSGGSTTVVLPFRTWSPENSRPSSSSTRHRWLAAWPGVWMTFRWCVAGRRRRGASCSPSASSRSGVNALAGACGRPRGQAQDGRLAGAQGLQRPRARANGRDANACRRSCGCRRRRRATGARRCVGVVRARVDHEIAGGRVADEVAVGAGPGHHARVGRRQPHHVLEQRHRAARICQSSVMHDLAVGARRAPVRRTAARAPCSAPPAPCQQAGARAAGPQRLLARRRRPAPPARWRTGRSRSSVRMVGKIMKKLPAAWRASASAGRTQTGSNCSASSATGSWPSGMRATRNGTSKRRGRSRSVIQWASTNTWSAASIRPRARHCATKRLRGGPARRCPAQSAARPSAWRASSTPSSSKLSRMAAMAWVRRRSSWPGRRRGDGVGLRRRPRRCRRRGRRRRRARSWRWANGASSALRAALGVSRSRSTVAAGARRRRVRAGCAGVGWVGPCVNYSIPARRAARPRADKARAAPIIRCMRIRFTKMQGAGNDFVVLDETRGPLGLTAGAIPLPGRPPLRRGRRPDPVGAALAGRGHRFRVRDPQRRRRRGRAVRQRRALLRALSCATRA